MKKLVIPIMAIMLGLFVVLGFSGDKKNENAPKEVEESKESAAIAWQAFDTGFKQAKTDDVYVMGYFWRPN